MIRRANYEIVKADAAEVVIRDLGPWTEFLTITNWAEELVRELVSSGVLKAGARLFYYDSEGELDELLLDGVRLVDFAPGVQRPTVSAPATEPTTLKTKYGVEIPCDSEGHPLQDAPGKYDATSRAMGGATAHLPAPRRTTRPTSTGLPREDETTRGGYR